MNVFLLPYENFLFTFYFIFVIEYGALIMVDNFRTKVFIIVKQEAVSLLFQDMPCSNELLFIIIAQGAAKL